MVTVGDVRQAAGFLEGEGSFLWVKTNILVEAVQNNLEPLQQLKSWFGGTIKGPYIHKGRKAQTWHWANSGPAAAGTCMTLYRFMSEKRKAQIRKALNGWRSLGVWNKFKTRCKNGHLFVGNNVRIDANGWRVCRACKREAKRRKTS